MSDFEIDLTALINRHSKENGSDTPDVILAQYMAACLEAFNAAVSAREGWYGRPRGTPSVVSAPKGDDA